MEESLSAAYSSVMAQLRDIADTYFKRARLDDALAVLEHAAGLGEHADVRAEDRLRVMLKQAEVLVRQASFATNDYGTVKAVLAKADEVAASVNDPGLVSGLLYARARVEYGQSITAGGDNLDGAAALMEKALAMRVEAGLEREAVEARLYQGYIAERRGETEAAGRVFEEVYESASRLGLPAELAEAERHLGFYELAVASPEEALVHFQRSLAVLEAAGNLLVLPFAHLSVGDTYLVLENASAATLHFEKAMTIADEAGIHRASIEALTAMGDLYTGRGEFREGRTRYEAAIARCESAGFTARVEELREKIRGIEGRE